jgi:hypothetical protein
MKSHLLGYSDDDCIIDSDFEDEPQPLAGITNENPSEQPIDGELYLLYKNEDLPQSSNY